MIDWKDQTSVLEEESLTYIISSLLTSQNPVSHFKDLDEREKAPLGIYPLKSQMTNSGFSW